MALGVFCIESWSTDLRVKGTVRPLLSFLEAAGDLNVVHQRVSSREELLSYVDAWARYDSYPVGFLAMHGSVGEVVAGSDSVTIEELIDATSVDDLEERSIDLKGKVLYLGSCSTFGTHPERIEALRNNTRARLVCGYARNVGWYEAAAFEVLLMSTLARHPARLPEALRRLTATYPDHVARLRFTSFPNYVAAA